MVYQRKYSWRDHSYGVSAQVAGEVMEKIEERDGTLTKEAFLEESRPEDAPTHKCFEWNDTVAAEKYRLDQSRHIINGIVVNVIKVDGEEEKAPAFVNVAVREKSDNATYRNIHVSMNDMEYRKQVLKNALYELNLFKRKYALYKELDVVFEAIRIVEDELNYR